MKTGIGITVHNRNETAKHTIDKIRKYAPIGSKIAVVDDASKMPFEGADFRFNVNAGVANAKNKCFELLDDCDYIFLFDDDCYPVVEDWHLPYIESRQHHLSFTFDRLANGKQNGNKVLLSGEHVKTFNNPCGCMCFYTKECLETVGGFNPAYNTYGYEHVDLSVRIHNAGLTSCKFMDVPNSLDLFHSLDYHSEITTSVQNRGTHIRANKILYDQSQKSKQYIPYKEVPKRKHKNVILTSYFNYTSDPQRGKRWAAQIAELMPLIDSCIKHKQRLIIFSDCFVDSIDSEYIEFVLSQPSKTHSPNVYRWIVYQEWMQRNEFEKCWMVDSTDVVLLKEPFKGLEHGKLYCGDECDMNTDNRWMRTTQERFISSIYDYRSVIAKFGNEVLINCGLVGGCADVILPLIDTWASLHKTKTVGLRYSTDMAIFNYVARKHYNDVLVHGERINTKFKHEELNNKKAIWKHK